MILSAILSLKTKIYDIILDLIVSNFPWVVVCSHFLKRSDCANEEFTFLHKNFKLITNFMSSKAATDLSLCLPQLLSLPWRAFAGLCCGLFHHYAGIAILRILLIPKAIIPRILSLHYARIAILRILLSPKAITTQSPCILPQLLSLPLEFFSEFCGYLFKRSIFFLGYRNYWCFCSPAHQTADFRCETFLLFTIICL